jgi:hypothetical protein
VSLFYLGEKPPHNFTLRKGAHDLDSTERAEATVRGFSFSAYIGKQFERVVNTPWIGVMARRKSEAGKRSAYMMASIQHEESK